MIDLVMLLHSALSAGTYLAAKRALGELSPVELALARFSFAGLVYAGLLLWKPRRVSRRDLLALAVLGFIAIPLNQGLFLFGLSLTTPGHAALLYAMTPIFVFVLALLRREERSSPWKTIGIAVAFAGAAVVLVARRGNVLRAVAAKCGENALPVVADVSQREEVRRVVTEALAHFGHVDVWVNNAGISGGYRTIQSVSATEIKEVIDINLLGTFYACRLLIPYFISRGGGTIINMQNSFALLEESHVSFFTMDFFFRAGFAN